MGKSGELSDLNTFVNDLNATHMQNSIYAFLYTVIDFKYQNLKDFEKLMKMEQRIFVIDSKSMTFKEIIQYQMSALDEKIKSTKLKLDSLKIKLDDKK